MTLPELRWAFETAAAIDQDERERMVELGWHVARTLVRSMTKDGGYRVPSLKTLLEGVQRPKPQSLAAMRESLLMLSAQYGIPVRTVDAAKG